MKDLQDLRNTIDEIDSKLVELFERRMEIALKIAAFKIKNKLPVFDEKREAQVIQKNLMKLKNRNFQCELNELFSKIMKLSRQIQIREFAKRSINAKEV